jgi:shikimate kinase
VIFVVGPSRGGKTTLLRAVLPEFPHLRLIDLDAEERRRVPIIQANGGDPGGWEGRWQRNRECLRAAETCAAASNVIVDVGAGSLQTPAACSFFAARGHSTIAVVASWPVVLARHGDRGVQEFRDTEYSEDRESVYRAARFQVDSSTDVEATRVAFRKALGELLGELDNSASPQAREPPSNKVETAT